VLNRTGAPSWVPLGSLSHWQQGHKRGRAPCGAGKERALPFHSSFVWCCHIRQDGTCVSSSRWARRWLHGRWRAQWDVPLTGKNAFISAGCCLGTTLLLPHGVPRARYAAGKGRFPSQRAPPVPIRQKGARNLEWKKKTHCSATVLIPRLYFPGQGFENNFLNKKKKKKKGNKNMPLELGQNKQPFYFCTLAYH